MTETQEPDPESADGAAPAPHPPDPETAAAHHAEGLTALAARHWPQAEAAFRAALDADPGLMAARLRLASLLVMTLHREEEGREIARPLETYTPPDAETWAAANLLFRRLHDPTRLQLVTRRFIAATGGTLAARFSLVRGQMQDAPAAGDRIDADIADLIAHGEETAGFWTDIAEIMRERSRLDDAQAAVARALRLAPEDFSARCCEAELLVRRDEFRAARRLLAALPALADQSDIHAWLRIAQVATEAHDAGVAEAALARAIPLLPDRELWLRFQIMRVLIGLEQRERAAAMGRDILARNPDAHMLTVVFRHGYDAGLNDLALEAGRALARVGPVYDIATKLEGLEFAARHGPADAAGPAAPMPPARSRGWFGRRWS